MIAPQQLDALDPQQMREALLTLMAEVAASRGDVAGIRPHLVSAAPFEYTGMRGLVGRKN